MRLPDEASDHCSHHGYQETLPKTSSGIGRIQVVVLVAGKGAGIPY
jgi:hypothetical protein